MNGRGRLSGLGRPDPGFTHSAALCPSVLTHTLSESHAGHSRDAPVRRQPLHKAQAPREARAALAEKLRDQRPGVGLESTGGRERGVEQAQCQGLGSFCTRGGLWVVRGTFCENVRNNLASGRKAISRTQRCFAAT